MCGGDSSTANVYQVSKLGGGEDKCKTWEKFNGKYCEDIINKCNEMEV